MLITYLIGVCATLLLTLLMRPYLRGRFSDTLLIFVSTLWPVFWTMVIVQLIKRRFNHETR